VPPEKSANNIITLPARRISVLTSQEEITLPSTLVASCGITFSLANQGLIQLFGPQINPGFKGRFIAEIFNAGPKDVPLIRSQEILKMAISNVSGNTQKPTNAPERDWLETFRNLDATITETELIPRDEMKSQIRDVNDKLAPLTVGQQVNADKLTSIGSRLDAIEGGYRTVTLFAVFLIAAAILVGALTGLTTSLAAIPSSSPVNAIIPYTVVGIPILLAIMAVFTLSVMVRKKKESAAPEKGIMSDDEIRTARQDKSSLVIEPFNSTRLQPSSYDLGLSSEAIVGSGVKTMLNPTITINPHELILFSTEEQIGLPGDIVGRVYLRSGWARAGLSPEGQGRVEAGFTKGCLTLAVTNMSSIPITIKKNDSIATIEFVRLNRPVSKGYSGSYSGATGPLGSKLTNPQSF